jgi:uncharacterized tellurite resistance protein B-like protein
MRAAVEDALEEAEELGELARPVTFWGFLTRRDIPGLTNDVLAGPLPAPKTPVATLAEPVAAPAPRPPGPAIPAAAPAAAKPLAQPFVLPPTAQPAAPPSATDLFKAALQQSATPEGAAAEEHPWLPKLRAYARFAFAIARADGRIARAEKKVIRAFLEEQFGHDAVLVRHIDPLIERTAAVVPDEAEAVAAVRAVTTDTERRDLFALAERITDASGPRNQRERDLLARLAAAFAIPVTPDAATAAPPPVPVSAATPPAPNPRALLEIDADTALTPELVRRRFTALTEKLDPAKAAAMGPEFARMAEEKRTRLRAAAEALIAPFGVPLDPPAPPPPADLRHNPDLDDVFQ